MIFLQCTEEGNGHVSLTLHSFAERVIRASKGEQGVVEPTFIYLPGVAGGDAIAKQTGLDFFSVPVELGVSRESKKLREEERTIELD